MGRIQQLDGIAKGGLGAQLGEVLQRSLFKLNALNASADFENLSQN